MNSARNIRILLLETDKALTTPAINILHSRSSLSIFDLTVVPTLSEVYREIEKEAPDIVLMDVDPSDEADLTHLINLHKVAPQVPMVVLLADTHRGLALSTVQKGAQGYLLASQIQADTLATTLLRFIERHITQKALLESEERLRLMVENASDIILILDRAGVISYSGPSSERILKTPNSELVGKNALDFLHRDDRSAFLTLFEKSFATNEAMPMIQFRFRLPNKEWIYLEGQGRIAPDWEGRPVCILNSHDITHRVKMEEELRALSLKDELTGLHNRRSFTTYLEHQMKVVQRSKNKGIYLMFIDLDGFKNINDTFGHQEGDHALIQAAKILKATFRDADLVARFGGDEFAVFLTSGLEGVDIETLKKRLFSSIDSWNKETTRSYQLAMSVGVVFHNLEERRSVTDLLVEADELMYKQKKEKKQQLGLILPRATLETPPEKKSPRSSVDSIQK